MNDIRGRERLLITRHRNHAVVDPRVLSRAVRSGEMLRLRSGADVRASVWTALTVDEQHRLEIAAALDATSSGLVVAGRSAAAIRGVPLLGRHDGLVHVRTSIAAGTRTEHGFRKHAVAAVDQHVVETAGLAATSRPRTVVDLTLSESFASGVVAVDWALRSGTRADELRQVLDEIGRSRGGLERSGPSHSGTAGPARSESRGVACRWKREDS